MSWVDKENVPNDLKKLRASEPNRISALLDQDRFSGWENVVF